jgi:hypothetical protein
MYHQGAVLNQAQGSFIFILFYMRKKTLLRSSEVSTNLYQNLLKVMDYGFSL